MTAALVFVAVLMLIGFLLRANLVWLRWLYIPASVVAGMLGLLIVQLARWSGTGPELIAPLSDELAAWPGWLIAVVFAALLLERQTSATGASARRTTSQVIMVWIIVVGQTAVGLLLTWLLIQPYWTGLPNSFGMLIETGFAGGHGTAAAMGQVFKHPVIDFPQGQSLGILMATVGLIYGVVSGIVWINFGERMGWVQKRLSTDNPPQLETNQHDDANALAGEGTPVPEERRPIGYEVVSSDLIEPLLLQAIWLALAFGIGLACQQLVATIAAWIDNFNAVETVDATEKMVRDSLQLANVLGKIPLFIYTLFGGWLVKRVLTSLGKAAWIEVQTISRLSAVAMDVLVIAAIASLNLNAVVELLGPFTVLAAGGCLWTGVCLLVISRRVLPRQHWFELGLINYGMSTGTTATGFVLLRVVDPDLKTDAPEDYALASPFSAPFIGGGLMTTLLPIFVLERIPLAITSIIATAVVIILIVIGQRLNRT